jgi:hypothetical protein
MPAAAFALAFDGAPLARVRGARVAGGRANDVRTPNAG